MGTRLIHSTPPAMINWSHPERTFCAAMFTASSAEAQNRLTWVPAIVSGRPAKIAAVLAMSAPWSPPGDAAEHQIVDRVRVHIRAGCAVRR